MRSLSSSEVIFILGPTAVGKTAVALRLARDLAAEIVSCDSMQVYREISVATSKPTPQEQKQVPHHLIDVVSVEEPYDVATYNRQARQAVESILKRGKRPLIVGGSGLYAQVLLDGIFEKNEPSHDLRRQLQQRAQDEGLDALYAQLKQVDPQAAAKIHANDQRRMVRALEVFYSTQTPISQLQKSRSGLADKYPVRVFVLDRRRDELYARINARVEQMFEQGVLEEIRALKDKHLSLTARKIIGVKELQGFIDGKRSISEAKEQMKMNTRRLAKRQLTWFRKDKRNQWVLLSGDDPSAAAQEILNEMRIS